MTTQRTGEGEAPAEPLRAAPPTPRHRRHPAHGVLACAHAPTIVFVTACTRNRQPWLANAAVHALLRAVWTEADAWLVGRYALMPDHLHLFCAPNEEGSASPSPGNEEGSGGASPSHKKEVEGSAGASPSP